MIEVTIGNLFESNTQTWVNTVNCVGIMGKGIAQEFKKRFPAMFQDYVIRCQAGLVRLGQPYHYTDASGTSIINFPTKDHWRSPSRLQDIEQGLDYFINHYQAWGIHSVAFPPLGCGNGGLEWRVVGPLMVKKLSPLPIKIKIFAPYGTPGYQLTHPFLNQPITTNQVGIRHPRLKDSWLALLEVVYQLSLQPYANPVGRTIFQKISYVMTELGVDTGFSFTQGNYGPFSPDVQQALMVIANANLVQEQQLGAMTALRPSPEYESQRPQLKARLAPFQKWIDKTVDLFSRIRNSAQAEMVTTVLYAARKLKHEKSGDAVSEQDVFDFIMAWKKKWHTIERQAAVSEAIRNLEILGWLKLTFSDSLPFESP
ncbi:MAG: macro domain-containing protein [Anaerolineae bacterium]|nr:macro domain-containing protein [Anaerolineae bacterium]